MWLSLVVHVTHSCSSFNGWGVNKRRVYTDNDKITTTSPALPTLVDQLEELPCTGRLNQELCQNGGRCVMRIEPICLCAKGWGGERCMEKVVEGNYNVKANSTTTQSSPTSTDTITTTIRPTHSDNLINVPTRNCPEQYDTEYCLNGGTCHYIGHGMPYLCICQHPFRGARCEEKSLDGIYEGIKRKSRDVSSSS